MWSPDTLILLTAVFLVGGLVKGVIGTGLPTVVVALLAAFFDVKTAILLLMAPAIATNVWQAFSGGAFLRLVVRLAPFLAAIFCGVLFGFHVLTNAGDRFLIGMLGAILCLYAIASLLKFRLPEPGALELQASAAAGLVNGTITGMTGTFVMPAVLYLQVLGFDRRELMQAMGITFLFSIAVLSLLIGVQAKLSPGYGLLSVLAVLPALAGQRAGQAIRDRLDEDSFRRIFLVGLCGLGAWLLVRAVAGF
jgi:uncharacterized protein